MTLKHEEWRKEARRNKREFRDKRDIKKQE
jgi:hypothetical protein